MARDRRADRPHLREVTGGGGGGPRGGGPSGGGPADRTPTYGYHDRKDEFLRRLRRIEGQVRGLQRMVDEDRYCIDILTQVASVTRALQSVALELLDEHVQHCVADAIAQGPDTGRERIEEAMAAIARLVRT